jgi:hypothetical protein
MCEHVTCDHFAVVIGLPRALPTWVGAESVLHLRHQFFEFE